MASGTVTFSAALYAPGGIGPSRALVTVTKWAGALPYDGADDETFEVSTGNDLTLTLDETTSQFCYRIVVTTPATYAEETRFVTVPAPGPTVYGLLPDVDPFSFAPTPVTPTLLETIDERVADAVPDAVADYLIANPPTGAPDATAGVKGILQLAGDLGGTASSPTVPGLAGKAALVHTHAQADVTGLTTALAGKAATAHTHAQSDVTNLTTDLAAKADAAATTAALAGKAATVHTHAQSDVTGLAAALALLAPLASPAFTGTPTGITKAHVGLGNVDNTADTAKPVSTAQQTALNLKAPLASPAFTGTPTGITKAHVGLGNVDNTADASKPVSTAQAAADAAVLAAAVPKSLVDAKGDLLVGSANDTVVRLAVGSNGQIPYADSSQAAGIRWDAPPAGGGGAAPTFGYVRKLGESRSYQPPSTKVDGLAYSTQNLLGLARLSLAGPIPMADLVYAIDASGSSGVFRFGFFAADANGLPGVKLFETTIVGTAGAGIAATTFAQSLTAGVYWGGWAIQAPTGTLRRLVSDTLVGDNPVGAYDGGYFDAGGAGPRQGTFLTIAAAGAFPSDLTGSTFGTTDNVSAWTPRSTT